MSIVNETGLEGSDDEVQGCRLGCVRGCGGN